MYLAKYFLGDESKIYKQAINEELSFATAIARFACQALIAHTTFKQLDKDGDGIEREELREKLEELMDGNMSKKDIATAVSVLFALGNKDEKGRPKIRRVGLGAKLRRASIEDPSAAKRDDNFLDNGEYVYLSTDDGVTYALLAK